jgi:hypothetical protein
LRVRSWVDEQLLGINHFYHDPTCAPVYDCVAYDPEGIMGAFSAAFLAFLGLVSGKVVKGIGLGVGATPAAEQNPKQGRCAQRAGVFA